MVLIGCGRVLFEQLFLTIDQCVDVGGSQLETMPVCDGIRRARFDTIAAKNATRIVDVVAASVAFPCGNVSSS
jgi:hypothetical protein